MLLFENTLSVTISEARFESNLNTNIRVDSASLNIFDSEFSNAKGNMIRASFSNLTLSNITMQDSTDFETNGMGILCSQCDFVTISNSTF